MIKIKGKEKERRIFIQTKEKKHHFTFILFYHFTNRCQTRLMINLKMQKFQKLAFLAHFYIFVADILCKDHKIIIKRDKIASKGQNQDYLPICWQIYEPKDLVK